MPWCCFHCEKECLPFSSISDSEIPKLFSTFHSEKADAQTLTKILNPEYLNQIFLESINTDTEEFINIDSVFMYNSSNQYICSSDVNDLKFNDSLKLSGFMTLSINIRSLASFKNYTKFEALVNSLNCKPHVIAINETWIVSDTNGHFNALDGYVFISNSRSHHRGGGVGLYIRNDLKYIVRKDLTIMYHIWTNVYDKKINSAVLAECISDHLPIVQCSLLEKQIQNRIETLRRQFTSSNLNTFTNELNSIDIDDFNSIQDPNICFEKFFDKFSTVYSQSFPYRTQTNRLNKPWYDTELRKLNKVKQKLYKKLINNKNIDDKHKSHYNECRNLYARLLHKKKSSYYMSKFASHKGNIKAVWKTINELIGKNKNNSCPLIELECSNTQIANKFNEHFSQVAQRLLDNMPQPASCDKNYISYLGRQESSSMFLRPTTALEIKNIIREMKPKPSFGIDGIPFKILKYIPEHITDILAYIFNLSLSTGLFIESFKTSKVLPLFKKGSVSDLGNYRPISLLPSFSKILEKIMYSRMSNYFETNNVFHSHQFGFRKQHSTAMAANVLVHKLTKAFEGKQHAIGIFLDISKAFDTIDHSILSSKLYHYGIRGVPFNWIRSYLQDRKQIVQYDNSFSTNICVMKHGVPQGSLLGPLFFLAYINDMSRCLKSSESIMFADDTDLILHGENLEDLFTVANYELANIHSWMLVNKLSLNANKTKFVLFHPSKHKSVSCTKPLLLNGNEIERVKEIKFLGVIFDENLSWKSHILHVIGKTKRNLAVAAKVSQCVNQSALLAMFQSLLLSHIRYCCSVWLHGNKTLVSKLQSICNNFLRILFRKGKRESVNHFYKKLNILKVEDIMKFEVLSLVHDFHNNSLPNCFDDILTKITSNRRSSSNLFIPFMSTSVSQHALCYTGPKLWNSLPLNLKTLKSKKSFQKKVKSYLVSKY
ncbi:uncharacterized protein LOC144432146 [Styela clava]